MSNWVVAKSKTLTWRFRLVSTNYCLNVFQNGMWIYLEATGVLEEILFEEQSRSSDAGQVRTSAGGDHNSRFDLESRRTDVLELDDARMGRIAPGVHQRLFRFGSGGISHLNLRHFDFRHFFYLWRLERRCSRCLDRCGGLLDDFRSGWNFRNFWIGFRKGTVFHSSVCDGRKRPTAGFLRFNLCLAVELDVAVELAQRRVSARRPRRWGRRRRWRRRRRRQRRRHLLANIRNWRIRSNQLLIKFKNVSRN